VGVSQGGTTTDPPPPVVEGVVDDASCMAFTPTRTNVLSPVDAETTNFLSAMTIDQKVDAMHGGACCKGPYNCDFNGQDSGAAPAAGLPAFKMRDGPRGLHGHDGEIGSTWAVAMARAASFDLDLEERVGNAQGIEMRAFKHDLSLAPTINTLRHPGWARAQETYGEDPVLLGEMGAAFVRGMQNTTPACPKHYAANNTDENRNTVSSNMDEQTLRENYTRAFQITVEKSDPACIMAAYNLVNGTYASENEHLLTDILRSDWGWTGFVVSDWWATVDNHGVESVNGGLDFEMPDDCAFNVLDGAIQGGSVTGARSDQSVERIMNVRHKWGQLSSAYQSSALNASIANTPEHQMIALETAEKGAVLLQNDGILPLMAGATIAVIGPDANMPAQVAESQEGGPPDGLGDRGSSEVNEPYAISVAQGLTEAGFNVTTGAGAADGAGADVVIIPVTMQHNDEGEAFGGGGDRDILSLNGNHPIHWGATKPSAFINAAAATNPNVIVLLMVGSAIIQEDWMGSARAIVQPFYPGQEGGRGIARLLAGTVNFSGKLPFTVATAENQYPVFGNFGASAAMDYLHGYRKFQAEALEPRYWFGHGLSYTTYAYSDIQVLCTAPSVNGRLNVQATVTNNGAVAGEEVVHLYIGYPNTGVRRPPKELKSFQRVALAPGESKVVTFGVPVRDMAYWDMTSNGWALEAGVEHTVIIAPNANPADPNVLSAPFTIQ
jgi:beta-glucosidase